MSWQHEEGGLGGGVAEDTGEVGATEMVQRYTINYILTPDS